MSSKVKNINWKNAGHVVAIIAILVFFTIDRMKYVLEASADVPIMDYWRYIVQFVDKLFEDGVTLSDLWIPQEGAAHRAIGMPMFFFLINVKYFGLNTQIEIALGAIATLINSLFLLYIFLRKMKWDNNVIKYGYLFIALCLFNINQWEILVLEFSLGFAARVLLIIVMLNSFDNLQKNSNIYKYIIYLIFAFVVACLTGSYAPGVLGAIVFVTIAQFVLEKENKIAIILKNVVVILVFSLGILLFFWDLGGGTGDSLGTNITSLILDGSVFKAILYMLGSSILHITSTPVLQNNQILLYIGAILFVLYMIAIYLFFKRQMYKKTYLPIMLMAYTACIILTISVGRIPMYGIYYVTSSRYVVDTTLGLCGICWIYLYEINLVCKKEEREKIKIKLWSIVRLAVSTMALFFILINFSVSYETEMGIAPHRKVYQQNLIDIMLENEEITDDQATRFQCDTIYVNQGIAIMKKYKLGVFGD